MIKALHNAESNYQYWQHKQYNDYLSKNFSVIVATASLMIIRLGLSIISELCLYNV